MNFRGFCLCFFALSFSVAAALGAPKKAEAAPYKGAIAIDANSGEVLFEENADIVNPPASVTKLMTFLVVDDRIREGHLTLQTPVQVTAEDSKIGGTQVWLKEGEEFTVEELLYALMIQSANDAAHALSRAAAGSRPAFVALMNERAKSLGMTATTFRSPHGLPPANRKVADGDLTSPRDLAKLSRALVRSTNILKYSAVKERKFREMALEPVVMRNHNHLIGRVRGVDGLKTGFTNGAGFCLAATAERDGRRVIVVVMGSPDRKTRDLHVADMIEKAFAKLPATSKEQNPISPIGSQSDVPRVQPTTTPESPVTSQPSSKPAPETPPPTVTFPGPIKPKR